MCVALRFFDPLINEETIALLAPNRTHGSALPTFFF